jgi:hypothetical protein
MMGSQVLKCRECPQPSSLSNIDRDCRAVIVAAHIDDVGGGTSLASPSDDAATFASRGEKCAGPRPGDEYL